MRRKLTNHGMSKTRLYTIWKNMKQRCYNPKRNRYKWYGAKGIGVCDEWQDFIPFMEWSLANGYTEELTLDREDSDRDYAPGNCRWVTVEDNSRKAVELRTGKKLPTRDITYKGKTQSIKAWAVELDFSYEALYKRIEIHKWEIERALTQPIQKRKKPV